MKLAIFWASERIVRVFDGGREDFAKLDDKYFPNGIDDPLLPSAIAKLGIGGFDIAFCSSANVLWYPAGFVKNRIVGNERQKERISKILSE